MKLGSACLCIFSIRIPEWGSLGTRLGSPCPCNFSVHIPERGSLGTRLGSPCPCNFSVHIPEWGSLGTRLGSPHPCNFSVHILERGSQGMRLATRCIDNVFERSWLQSLDRCYKKGPHDSPCGVTSACLPSVYATFYVTSREKISRVSFRGGGERGAFAPPLQNFSLPWNL